LVGIFQNPTDVIEEMKAQASFNGCELADLDQKDNFIYATADKDGETWVVYEASLEEVK
jgi:hypothetical protein